MHRTERNEPVREKKGEGTYVHAGTCMNTFTQGDRYCRQRGRGTEGGSLKPSLSIPDRVSLLRPAHTQRPLSAEVRPRWRIGPNGSRMLKSITSEYCLCWMRIAAVLSACKGRIFLILLSDCNRLKKILLPFTCEKSIKVTERWAAEWNLFFVVFGGAYVISRIKRSRPASRWLRSCA